VSDFGLSVEDDGDYVVVAVKETLVLIAVDIDELIAHAEKVEIALGDFAEMTVLPSEKT
jgi:hypothetical protein